MKDVNRNVVGNAIVFVALVGLAVAGFHYISAKRGNAPRLELEKRIRNVIRDVREALRLGVPGAVDAIHQLEVGAQSLVREYRALVEDATAHREQDDGAEDEGEPTA
jgi:hypothetical protein